MACTAPVSPVAAVLIESSGRVRPSSGAAAVGVLVIPVVAGAGLFAPWPVPALDATGEMVWGGGQMNPRNPNEFLLRLARFGVGTQLPVLRLIGDPSLRKGLVWVMALIVFITGRPNWEDPWFSYLNCQIGITRWT